MAKVPFVRALPVFICWFSRVLSITPTFNSQVANNWPKILFSFNCCPLSRRNSMNAANREFAENKFFFVKNSSAAHTQVNLCAENSSVVHSSQRISYSKAINRTFLSSCRCSTAFFRHKTVTKLYICLLSVINI